MILSMLIQPGMTPIAKTVWCAAAANSGGGQSEQRAAYLDDE
jgi:hypothetical protein